MRRHVQFLIFFVVFMSLLLVMHYYILAHVTFLLRIPQTVWFWVFMVASSLSYMAAMGLEMRYANTGTRAFYTLTAVWLGVLFLLLFTLIGYDIVRLVVPIDPFEASPWIFAIVGGLSTFGVLNAMLVRVREVELPAPAINSELRVVHISDLHVGSVHGSGFLRRIVGKVNALRPDLVLITGDLADGPRRFNEVFFSPLADIEAPAFLSTGNHEYYMGLDEVTAYLERTEVTVLRNARVDVGQVQLVGVDDSWDKDMVGRVLDGLELDPGRYTILMYHRPVGLEDASEAGVDLMLSGHTHGGQFFPFQLMAWAFWRRFKGLYEHDGTYLHASQGTGTWGPPMRLGTSNEVTLLRLVGDEPNAHGEGAPSS